MTRQIQARDSEYRRQACTPEEGPIRFDPNRPVTCVGGPHLRAVNLIHPIGRNLKNLTRLRRQNDTTAMCSEHAVIASYAIRFATAVASTAASLADR